jgi:GntR family transcriptional regulator
MHITVDEQDARPIYQQIVDEIKRLIARGELQQGAPLPSVRQLASDLAVNFNTVAGAYRELQHEGLISVRHGLGAVVASLQINARPSEALRVPLRTALTQFLLAGNSRLKVMRIVDEELRALSKGKQ